eukprot:12921826-Alexandrium_andersonii.AAC.1
MTAASEQCTARCRNASWVRAMLEGRAAALAARRQAGQSIRVEAQGSSGGVWVLRNQRRIQATPRA